MREALILVFTPFLIKKKWQTTNVTLMGLIHQHEIKETVNNLTREAYDKHQKELDIWKEKHREYSALWTDLRAKFTTWRTNELERISNLKITIPSSLKDTFLQIKEIADTSK